MERRKEQAGISRFGRHTIRIGVPVAIVMGAGALAYAGVHTFNSGDTLQAQDLNDSFTALNQRIAALETSVATGAWTSVPIATNAPIDVWPDGRYGSGLEYKNFGPMTCLDGLLRTTSANFTGTVAILPTGARPHVWLVLPLASSQAEIQLQIGSDGVIVFRDVAVTSGQWVSFAGVCFPNQ